MGSPRTIFELATRVLAPSAARRVILSAAGDADREHTAGALLHDAEAVARGLAAAGHRAGDLVLLEGLTAGRFVIACLAAWSRDAAVLPADASTAPGEMTALRAAFTPRVSLRAGEVPGGLVVIEESPGAAGAPEFEPPAGTAVIKMTSGSTGRPRGVAATADQLLADGRHIIQGMGVRPDDVNVSAVPLSHSYGQGSVLMPLLMQGTAMLVADPRHAESFARTLSGEAPMVFPGVPTLFGMLGRPDAPPVSARGLRLCLSAGALLPAATARAFRARVGQPVRAFYGTSETGGISFDASTAGDAAEREEGAVGTPLPGVEITLDADSGRVVVGGDAVAIGYTDTSDTGGPGRFEDGRFLTGDLGTWTETGARESTPALRLTGRVGDIVNVAGRKVDPREVERILRDVDGVRDVVVLGVPDAARGESLAACLEADACVTREGVMARLRSELAPHKLPRRLLFMDRLPRTERGKTDRDALRRSLREAGDAGG